MKFGDTPILFGLFLCFTLLSCSGDEKASDKAATVSEDQSDHQDPYLSNQQQASEDSEDFDFSDKKGITSSHVNGSHLTYENARSRCEFISKADRKYNIYCYAAAIEKGVEIPATTIDDDAALSWLDPQYDKKSISRLECQVTGPKNLAMECIAELAEDSAAIDIGFKIEKISTKKTRDEKSKVVLPYGVNTYGTVYTIPLVYSSNEANLTSFEGGESEVEILNLTLEQDLKPAGFQTKSIPFDRAAIEGNNGECFGFDNNFFFYYQGVIFKKDKSSIVPFVGYKGKKKIDSDMRIHALRLELTKQRTDHGSHLIKFSCGEDHLFLLFGRRSKKQTSDSKEYTFDRLVSIDRNQQMKVIWQTPDDIENELPSYAHDEAERQVSLNSFGEVIYSPNELANQLTVDLYFVDKRGQVKKIADLPVLSDDRQTKTKYKYIGSPAESVGSIVS